jgi:poly-gamma-glutamate synthase PgsB/CapB
VTATAAVPLTVLLGLVVATVAYWHRAIRGHDARIDQLDVRIHVNGIRGKSTVTRLVAAVLREGSYVALAKTTGSAARVILPTGEELPIRRRGAATINEQLDVVAEHVLPEVDALVVECMAVRPLYQKYSQEFMIRSDVTIITNVRLDHQEEMGETLEEIADSLCETVPWNGVLVTAEDRPHLRERLERTALARGSRFVHADPASVLDEDMTGFDYIQFKENVAIGLAVADMLGIPRARAVEGMWKSVPDVGVVRLRTYEVHGKEVLWVPLFAANDRESVIFTFETLVAQFPEGAPVIGILNNRSDRGRRAELFAHMVPDDLDGYLDHVITFGAYEDTVVPTMVERGYAAGRIHKLGDTVNPSLEDILETVARLIPGERGVLVGMVNIHTHQAELLIEHFHELAGSEAVDEIAASREWARAPRAVARMRSATLRPPAGTGAWATAVVEGA